jgi:hypothetical protein
MGFPRSIERKVNPMKYRNFILLLTMVISVCPGIFCQQRGNALAWPRPIPCRIADGQNPDLFVMTLGDVKTSIAQGVFDPVKDEVRLGDGRLLKNYYRDTLGIGFYAPIDKSIFPLSPSGWCSWYYYYQEIDEAEVLRNAQWLAENLKDYGANYVQIDDGWQGRGHGMGDNRDWSTIDKRFSGGMDRLASSIKHLGFKAGIWLAPHGQSNPAVVQQNPGAFLLKADGSTASDTWEGKYLVDPSTPAGLSYLKSLFTTLSGWGYDYFKIDGQPIVVDEFKKWKGSMKHPPEDVVALYRSTLKTIRETIGAQRYLLGCWGIPLEGVGNMNGSRTGGDIVLGWDGFKVALDATMKDYFLHNVAWYCDPDVMLLRSPMTVDQARTWATLQGLTGQALMASDRMQDLSAERVEILRRVFPAVDIRPLDLFPSQSNKRIWDLKVSKLGRSYDVVGVFNFQIDRREQLFLRWNDLGFSPSTLMHVFDFWNGEYLGAWEGAFNVETPPTACRVLTLFPDDGRIQLVSTNRHITQGWVDLVRIEYKEAENSWLGASKVIKDDPYQLRFVFPRGKNFAVKNASAGKLPVKVLNHQGWAVVEFTSPVSGEIPWQVGFEPAPLYTSPVRKPGGLSLRPIGLDGALLLWESQYYLSDGYEVSLNGELVGHAPGTSCALRNLRPAETYTVTLKTVLEDGTKSKDQAELKFRLDTLIDRQVALSDLEPLRATIGWGSIEMNHSVTGGPLSVGGKKFRSGIGTHAASDVQYDLHGLFGTFTSGVGVDEGSRSEKGSVEFIVLGDGKELWRSGVLKRADGLRQLHVSVAGVRLLTLRVTDAGDGNDSDHADWVDARLERNQ